MTRITGKILPPSAEAVLRSIMEQAGIESCEITSVGRTVEDQSRVMFDLCIQPNGVAKTKALYLNAGDQIVDVFVKYQALPRAQVEALMAEKIREVGPGNVSHHICDSVHDVFDVAPSSIPAPKKAAFLAEIQARLQSGQVMKFLQPPADPAYHIEVPKSQ